MSLANARRGNLPKFQARQLKQNSFYCIKEIATVCLRNNAMTSIEFRQPETFAKLVILNFSQKSEESYSLFYKDFSLSLRSRSK